MAEKCRLLVPVCPPPHTPRRYEQYITYGGAVLQVFQMYRLVVLPVANTWMSWSLLHKLGITPGPLVVATSGAAVAALIVAGVQVGRCSPRPACCTQAAHRGAHGRGPCSCVSLSHLCGAGAPGAGS